jgi:hypothetical protein
MPKHWILIVKNVRVSVVVWLASSEMSVWSFWSLSEVEEPIWQILLPHYQTDDEDGSEQRKATA